MEILRETPNYIATKSARGVRITTKDKMAEPQSRVVNMALWNQLNHMDDACFDGSCVLEVGIGTFQKEKR